MLKNDKNRPFVEKNGPGLVRFSITFYICVSTKRKTMQNNQLLAYNFEVYTYDEATGVSGWDIKFPNVFAESKTEAKRILKEEYPLFDCVILFNHSCEMDELDILEYSRGKKYRDTNP